MGVEWTMAIKLTDNRNVFKTVYQLKTNTIGIVEIPDLTFLALKGAGPLEILEKERKFWVFYKIQNQLRSLTSKRLTYNFRQMPIEIEWNHESRNGDRSWTAMVQVPDLVDEALYQEALDIVMKKNNDKEYSIPNLIRQSQGLCAQKLHAGHWRETGTTVQQIETHVKDHGYKPRGLHREIYISVRHMNPIEKWRTIIRVPLEFKA